MKNYLESLNESFNKINIKKASGKLFEDFTGDESESGIDKEDILDWLSEHEQLWNDCEKHFVQDPTWLSADELEGFISDHDVAFDDYCAYFKVDLDEDGELYESKKSLKETKNSVTLLCELEPYERYWTGRGSSIQRVKVSGKDHLEAVKKLVDNLQLYITSEIIDENQYTFEDVINSIESSNGDGCDYIITLKDDKGDTFIDSYYEQDDWEDLDEEKKPYVKTWDPKMQGYYDGRFYITELDPKEKPGRFTGIVDLSRDEDGHPIDEGKSFDFDKINKKLHGNIKLKNESLLKEDQMDTNYRAFLQRINNALQLLDNYIALTSKSISPSKNTDKKIAQDGLQALKLLYKYIQQKPGR